MSWLLKGLLIGAGIALAGVLIAGTGGLAAAAIVGGLAAAGGGVGEVLATMSWAPKEVTGVIAFPGAINVFINCRPAVRAHAELVLCSTHPYASLPIATGSNNVFINNLPAARVDDKTGCGGVITDGSANVFIGGGTVQTDAVHPEDLVPGWVHGALLAVGVVSALVLAGPVVAAFGLAGGYIGGWSGAQIGGAIWGEGSDGQKWATLGGSFLGGMLATKGGTWFNRRYTITYEGLGSNLGNVRIRPRPEKIYLGSKKHGIKWTEGPAHAKRTNKPQGQWGSRADLEFAGEKAATLKPGEGGHFDLPADHSSVVHKPDGTTVPAKRIWVRNNGTGTFHGYPME